MNRASDIAQLIEVYVEEELPASDAHLPPKIQRVVGCIHNNILNEQLTVDQIYQTCFIKDHNFSAKFAHYMGQPPKQYIEHHRIELAKRLLAAFDASDIHISTIAFETGFSAVSSFSRLFKRKTGMTPTEWREKNQ